MAESFLEEQLKRMREMSEQMSRASRNAAEPIRWRAIELNRQDPLHEVRDLRTHISPRPQPKERSDDHAGSARRPPRHPARRRR